MRCGGSVIGSRVAAETFANTPAISAHTAATKFLNQKLARSATSASASPALRSHGPEAATVLTM